MGSNNSTMMNKIIKNPNDISTTIDCLRKCNLEKINLIYGLDFTDNSKYYHTKSNNIFIKLMTMFYYNINKYNKLTSNRTHIEAYCFGDVHTRDNYIFPLDVLLNLPDLVTKYQSLIEKIVYGKQFSIIPFIKNMNKFIDSHIFDYNLGIIITPNDITNDEYIYMNLYLDQIKTYPFNLIIVGIGGNNFSNYKILANKMSNNFVFIDYVYELNSMTFGNLFEYKPIIGRIFANIFYSYRSFVTNKLLMAESKPDSNVSDILIENRYLESEEDSNECPICMYNIKYSAKGTCGHEICRPCSLIMINKPCVICTRIVSSFT
jgi:hypothetical protein